MKKKRKIFIDLDGVMANWEGKAAELLGVDLREDAEMLKVGTRFELLHPDVWKVTSERKEDFWYKLDKFPWSDNLYRKAKELGDVTFLTSMGDHMVDAERAAYAAYAKVKWVRDHYPNTKLILTQDKYLCADENSLLIDDTLEKIEAFELYGGHGLHFPHAYKILDKEITEEQILGNLEEMINSM